MRSSCHCALKSSIPTKSCSKNQKAAYVHKLTISLRGNENLHGGSVVVGIDDGDARMELAQPLKLPDQKLVVVACELVQPPDATCLCLILFFVIAPEDEQVVGDAPNKADCLEPSESWLRAQSAPGNSTMRTHLGSNPCKDASENDGRSKTGAHGDCRGDFGNNDWCESDDIV